MTDDQQRTLFLRCVRVFSPSAPVNKMDLFAGRLQQIGTISEAIAARGRHVILYGDRGVGKTSLANILREYLSVMHDTRIVKVNCVESDTFLNVWNKALAEIPVILEYPNPDGGPENPVKQEEYTLNQYLGNYTHVGPGEIRKVLQVTCTEDSELVIVFDEFDTLPPEHCKTFADTIKDLSDNSVNATLILVGVAQDVTDLIAEHQSIDRCLTQTFMPPMTRVELRDIITKALSKLQMTIESRAADLIVSLSQGYPHYTHLLGQEAAKRAITQRRLDIVPLDAAAAIKEALNQTQRTVREGYYKAAEGQRKGSLYPKVLLACALAKIDQMGYFRAGDVSDPLSKITGEDYDTPNFSEHLDKFSTDTSRGPILERWGTARRFRYRFRNPMLRPFIIMKGLDDAMLNGTLLEQITGIAMEPTPPPPEPGVMRSLFE